MSGAPPRGPPWHPPAPSLAALPVDRTKTEPKPAYYKLQFGDDVTGFSYYVRTLTVVVGRNCERAVPVPPPAITSPTVPPIPPLEKPVTEQHSDSPPIPFADVSILKTPPITDFAPLPDPSPYAIPPTSDTVVPTEPVQDVDQPHHDTADELDATSEKAVSAPGEEVASPVTAQEESPLDGAEAAAPNKNTVSELVAKLPAAPASSEPVVETEIVPQAIIKEEAAQEGMNEAEPAPEAPNNNTSRSPMDVESTASSIRAEPEVAISSEIPEHPPVDIKAEPDLFNPYFAVPPPPPAKLSSAPVDHVDVDLGPLKSVSRNHARIEYRPDLGHFCLDIYGRNGAWVDDRYYVKGSTVPLNQGSQIQIATRIFSFNLPPSAVHSPAYSEYGLEDTSNSLDDVPYPYNLPPGQVRYAEFYGEPGPGPASAASIAARVPLPFNAFAAADGFGLGIEGVGGRTWDDEWDSDGDSGDDSWDSFDEDSEEGEDDGEGEDEEEEEDEFEAEEGKEPKPKLKIRLKAGANEDVSESPKLPPEGESEQSGVDMGGKKKKIAGQKKGVNTSTSAQAGMDGGTQETGPKGGKGVGKNAKKKTKKDEEAMDVDGEITRAQSDLPESNTTPSKAKKKKPVDKGDGEQKVSLPPKKEWKKKKAAAVTAPAPPDVKPTPPVSAPVPPPAPTAGPVQTLAAVMAEAQKSAPPPPPTPLPTHSQPVLKPAPLTAPPSTPAPPRPAPPAAIVPPHLQRTAPSPASPSSSTGGNPANFSRAGSVSTGPPEPPRPFYLTELIETPGQPGHIVVNVPIPPSGAGPRPPPGPLIGLDGKTFIGPPPLKPTATFATIIHRALINLPRGRGTLGEVCNWVAGEWEWFRLNIDAGWQNSIRHNLSLNKAFLKVPRIPEDDPESKGSVWIIDPEEGPLFEEKQRRDAAKSAGKEKSAEVKRERDRQKTEERQRKQRDMAMGDHVQTHIQGQHPHVIGKPMPVQRATPIPPRPISRPAPVNPGGISANSKGLLQPKAKITVSIQTLTPAHRAKSVISTTDAAGNPLPFACDGTTLTLDQATFGHLTGDIIDKLTLLGAAGAVDVLSAWVINKNKNQAARAAQAQVAQAQANAKPTSAAAIKAGLTARAANGANASPANTAVAAAASALAPKIGTVAKPSTIPAKSSPAGGKALPGPAPPGASLTKVISMIAEVANAKGDVNTVGPNASALLRYIRVVGVDIDLRVAERIWATGVVPPLPKKGAVGTTATPTKPNGAVTSASGSTGTSATATAGATTGTSTSTAAANATGTAGTTAAPTTAVKRKLESDGGADEAKRPKVEASSA